MKPLQLSRSYTAGSETFDKLEFRDVKFADYRRLGHPYEVQQGVVVVDRDVVFGYGDLLLQRPQVGALSVLDLTDVLALEDHVLNFFTVARASRSAPPSSSSDSGGTQAASTE